MVYFNNNLARQTSPHFFFFFFLSSFYTRHILNSVSIKGGLRTGYKMRTEYSLRSKRSFSTKRASKRFSANWPRGSWGKRLRERLQEDPLFLKNAHLFIVDLTHAD